jgi:predicted nucleic-acid-binding Zn-ribbon protein
MSLKKGICPQCESDEVYSGANVAHKVGGNESNTIPIDFWTSAALDNYVCADCGYVESYIADDRALETVKAKWERVPRE